MNLFYEDNRRENQSNFTGIQDFQNSVHTNSKTVLIIEDYPTTRVALLDLVLEAGFDVLCASNGCEAFKKLAAKSVDVVICKNRLFIDNGLAICKKIKEKNQGIVCLLLTDFGDEIPVYLLKQFGIEPIPQIHSGIDRLINYFNKTHIH